MTATLELPRLTSASKGSGRARASDVRPGDPPRIETAVRNANQADQRMTIRLRANWMRALGATDDEIAESCNLVRHPGSLQEEQENIRALGRLQRRNVTTADLKKLSKKLAKQPDRFHQ